MAVQPINSALLKSVLLRAEQLFANPDFDDHRLLVGLLAPFNRRDFQLLVEPERGKVINDVVYVRDRTSADRYLAIPVLRFNGHSVGENRAVMRRSWRAAVEGTFEDLMTWAHHGKGDVWATLLRAEDPNAFAVRYCVVHLATNKVVHDNREDVLDFPLIHQMDSLVTRHLDAPAGREPAIEALASAHMTAWTRRQGREAFYTDAIADTEHRWFEALEEFFRTHYPHWCKEDISGSVSPLWIPGVG